MQKNKFAAFIFKSVIFGFAAAFIILILRPDLLGSGRPVVEVNEVAPSSRYSLSGDLAGSPVSYADAVDIAAPSVVNVYTTKVVTERANPLYRDPFFRYFFGDQLAPRKRLESSLGSGVIVSDNGYILTNNHVVEGADEIQVALRDKSSAEAIIVGTDPESDLAVLKIALEKLPAITIGESDASRVGDVVLAIGNPFGVGQTVTMGIISAKGRNSVGINTYENFLQTDAAINPGNSGGALINPYGHLIGVNTAIFSKSGGSQGIGFAIPANFAIDVMQQIIQYGRVVRGYLGIEVQDITPELAESFRLKDPKGVIVAGLLRNGPAAKAGLRPGDVILDINGKEIHDTKEVMNTIAKIKPNDAIKINVLRQGKKMELNGNVGERPTQRPG
ncbi:MAG: Do family serine endopeptidase [Gammaproteobacteria bacterium]|nr:Do family serine endopeptidase [Gammaproteobacteria bacterium]